MKTHVLSCRACTSAAALMLASAICLHFPALAGEENAAVLKGTITVSGQPLASGRILFHSEDDQFVGAKIKDGAYIVKRIAPGRYKVSIEAKGIAAAYAAENTTPLLVEVSKGAMTIDLNLK